MDIVVTKLLFQSMRKLLADELTAGKENKLYDKGAVMHDSTILTKVTNSNKINDIKGWVNQLQAKIRVEIQIEEKSSSEESPKVESL